MSNFPEVFSKALGKQSLRLKDNSPKILFVAGIIGVVGSAVLACRATIKLPKVLDEFKGELDAVKEKSTELEHKSSAPVNTNRELAIVYARGTGRLVKLYGPPVVIGAVSIGMLTTSHVQLTRRNASLAAAFTALQSAYDAYRARVREELGDEKELALYRNERTETITVGDKVKKIKTGDPTKHSIYARCFDETSDNWQKNAELNKIFVKVQETHANHILRARGHIFLNEVYDMLGLERSREGAVVGWVMDGNGDNFVDFGLYESNENVARFMNGLERSIWLDFNVDGLILNNFRS